MAGLRITGLVRAWLVEVVVVLVRLVVCCLGYDVAVLVMRMVWGPKSSL